MYCIVYSRVLDFIIGWISSFATNKSTMDNPIIANNSAHEHNGAEDVNEERINEDHANDSHDTADGDKESNQNNVEKSWDDCSKVDLIKVFQNTDDNPIEYIYIRDSTGRVVSVDCRLKVPRNQVEFLRTFDENGVVVDVECRFKKTIDDEDDAK